ncbi:MAG TPA: hypothetical protein VHD83_10260 [Puia sp.]|nr:hypothetical protein [Puia sp.]
MFLSGTIQYKALLLLTVFAANFFVVCHCSARVAEHPSCCSKKEAKSPCKEGNECGGMHAVKFNLLEKQAAKQVSPEPMLAAVIIHIPQRPLQILHSTSFLVAPRAYKHPPPDYQSLYQCFLI